MRKSRVYRVDVPRRRSSQGARRCAGPIGRTTTIDQRKHTRARFGQDSLSGYPRVGCLLTMTFITISLLRSSDALFT